MKFLIVKPFFISLVFLTSCGSNSELTVEPKIDLKDSLSTPTNDYLIDNSKDTIIFGEQGTAVFIPADAFYIDSTEDNKNVKITLEEYYSMSDIVMQDLTTVTNNGDMLETGGMINLNASLDDAPLYLKFNRELIVHFPRNGSTKEDMKLYSRTYSDTLQSLPDGIKWEEEPRSDAYEEDSILQWYTKFNNKELFDFRLADGSSIYNHLNKYLPFTDEEREYVRFRDVNIKYDWTTRGKLENIRYEKKYDETIVSRFMKCVQTVGEVQPILIDGVPTDNPGWIQFYIAHRPSKIKGNKNYLKTLEKKYPEFEKNSINDLEAAELHYFIFSSAKLGWLNVDRLVDDPAPKVNMTLKLDEPEDLMVKLIYTEYKSVIPANFENGIYSFNNIPSGKKFSLLIIRNEPGKITMSITNHTTKEGAISGIDFKEYTVGELKEALKKLN